MKRLITTVVSMALLAGCQTTGTGGADPFAKTRQPVPEAQFKNGVATSQTATTSSAAETPDTKKVISPNRPSTMNVVAVVIDAKNAKKGFGAAFSLDQKRAAQIADQIITEHLEKYDNDSATPVVVDVHLEMLYLAGGVGVLLGSTNSAARAKLGVYDTRSSEILLNAIDISAAGSKRLPGLIGGVQVEGQEQEMARVSQGLAEAIRKKLFGG